MKKLTSHLLLLLASILLVQTSNQTVNKERKSLRSSADSIKAKSAQKPISQPFLSEKDMFAIEVLDRNKPEDRQKIFNIIFNSDGVGQPKTDPKINKKRMLVLLYKFLLDESYDHISDISKKQRRGKKMTNYEQEILVNVHLIQNYLDDVIEQRASFSKSLAMALIDKEKFFKYTSSNHEKILKDLNDKIHDDPYVLDAGLEGEESMSIDL